MTAAHNEQTISTAEAERIAAEWFSAKISAVVDVFEECDDDAEPQELRELVLAALGVG